MKRMPAPGWRVQVDEHDVGRWRVEKQVVEVRAIDPVQARVAAAREAHRVAAIPPWRPLLRFTYLRTRVVGSIVDPVGRDTATGGRR